MTGIEDQLITRELNAAPAVAERTPALLRSMQSLNAEVATKHRRRSRGVGIAVAAGAFTLLGTTAAVAAPAIQLLWQPDDVVSYFSETAGHCAISVLNESENFEASGLHVNDVEAVARKAIEDLDLSETGRGKMVHALHNSIESGTAGMWQSSGESADALSAAAFEEQAVSSALFTEITQRFTDIGWRFEGRMSVICDGVER